MTLRTKTLIIIGLTLVGLISLLYLFTHSFWLDGFAAVEASNVRRDVRQALAAIDADLEGLTTLSSDYAGWDDTYRFVVSVDDSYIRSNLIDSTFIDTGLNLMVFLDGDGRSVFTKAFDSGREQAVEPPPEFADARNALPELLQHTDTTSSIGGIVAAGGRIMLVTSHPIVRSDKTGPIRGTLIMGRWLDEARRRRIAEKTGLALRLVPLDPPPSSPQAPAAFATLAAGAEDVLVEPRDSALITGYALSRDLRGEPAMLVRVDRDREIFRQGRRTFVVFLGILVLSGLVLGGVMIVLLERVVLRRISDLAGGVRTVGRTGDLSARLPIRARDELSDLAGSINDTLDTLERSQGALQYISKHARCVLWSATATRADRDGTLRDFEVQDEDAAQRLLPLDIFHGGSYAHAWKRSIHPDDQERVREAPFAAIESGQSSYRQEFRVRGMDRRKHWIQEEVDIEAAAPDRWRLVGVCTDLTAHKQAEAELQRARDAALEISAMKSDFLANMSHEIRTPMNGILGMTTLLRDTGLSAEQQEYVHMMAASADALLRVINDVLDFSKIEAGRLEIAEDEFDLHRGVADAISLMALRAHQKGLELVFEIDGDVPRSCVGDSVRLRQILVNLTGNAIKFTEDGEVAVHVSCEPVGESQFLLHAAVRDTGIGIPDEKQAVIFDAFRQADSSTTRQYGGTGLGLAISARLAHRMHGRLWVESVVDRGSTFHFTVLLKRGTAEAAPTTPPAGLQDVRALVIDDNETTLGVVARQLEGWGLRVATASGVEHARTQLDEATAAGDPVGLLVCDGSLPDGGGFALVASLRDIGAFDGPLVMLLTAVDRAGDAARCCELGIDAAVVKPVRRSELLRAMLAALGLAAVEEDAEQAAADGTLPTRSLQVLLAEDNPVNQRVAVKMIERQGHCVTVVEDGRGAVDAVRHGGFDVVLMDIQMPRLSGFETTALIRAHEGEGGDHIPIIAMTAHALKGDRERCLKAGMDGYVAKPISSDVLFAEIDRVISEHPVAVVDEPPPAEPQTRYDHAAALAGLGGDESLLVEVIGLFQGEYAKQRTVLRQAAESDDLETIRRTTHALRGALGNLHAARAIRAALALEEAAESGDGETARTRLVELEAEIEGLECELANHGRTDAP